MNIYRGDSMTKRPITEQLTVAALEKAIDDLLLAHKAVRDAWFTQWEEQQRQRVERSFRARESARQDAV
jgi:hypothetical protein